WAVREPSISSSRVQATVLSYSGPPRVRLDDRWDVTAVTPSAGNLAAYDVDVLLDDASPRPHHLSVLPPEGPQVAREFAPPSLVRSARALVIGNAAYRHPDVPKLPGALQDAGDLARALQRPETWHLSADRVRLARDLDAATMEREVTDF